VNHLKRPAKAEVLLSRRSSRYKVLQFPLRRENRGLIAISKSIFPKGSERFCHAGQSRSLPAIEAAQGAHDASDLSQGRKCWDQYITRIYEWASFTMHKCLKVALTAESGNHIFNSTQRAFSIRYGQFRPLQCDARVLHTRPSAFRASCDRHLHPLIAGCVSGSTTRSSVQTLLLKDILGELTLPYKCSENLATHLTGR